MEYLIPRFQKFSDVIAASGVKHKLLRLFDFFYHCMKFGKKSDYILIDVFSTTYFWGIVILAAVLKVFGLKYHCFLHGGNLPYRLKNNPKISRFLFGSATSLIAPSKYLKDKFEERGYSCKLILNSVDDEFPEYKYRQTFSAKLLYVRSIADLYNPLMAVRILKRLKNVYDDASLCMIGKSEITSYEKVLEEIKKNKLNDSFKYLGIMSKKEWHKLSMEYDFFLNTTNIDNTPISIIEAMNLGLCIVSTDVGGIPYMLTDKNNALLVNRNDDEDATIKIIDAIEHPKKTSELIANAKVEGQKYLWKNVEPLWKDEININV